MQDAASTTTEQHKQYQCRHIFTDGHRCASPCLRQEEFCYYHHTTRCPVANPKQRRGRRSTFHLPLPEDRSVIQASIGEVLQRIAANDINPRRAGLLLYGLQIASLNLPKPQPLTKPEPQTVEEITIDPTLGVLAPRTDISETARPKSAVALLIERMLQSKEEEEKPAPTPQPATIPTLQATADSLTQPTKETSSPRLCNGRRLYCCHPAAKRRDLLSPLLLPVLHTQPQKTSFRPNPERSRRGSGEIRFSTASLTTTSVCPTSGSNTPCPPAHRAYTQSWPWRQASDRHRAPRTPDPQNPCSWSQ